MKDKRRGRTAMEVGDRVLVRQGFLKRVYIVARVEIPHSTERVFVSQSGGDFTIGRKIWKADYVWNEKSQMWIPKN